VGWFKNFLHAPDKHVARIAACGAVVAAIAGTAAVVVTVLFGISQNNSAARVERILRSSEPHRPTQIEIFPVHASGEPIDGPSVQIAATCVTPALQSERVDSARCFKQTGGILDPCFFDHPSLDPMPYCPSAFHGGVIQLVQPQGPIVAAPPSDGIGQISTPPSGPPWALVLTSGLRCLAEAGGAPTVGGSRVDYECFASPPDAVVRRHPGIEYRKPAGYLLGNPDRANPQWTVFFTPPSGRAYTQVGVSRAYF
jgi:hypothetical protein